MIYYRLNTLILKSLLCLVLFTTVMQYNYHVQAAIAPERDVIIIDNPDKSDNPSWKNIWDEARRLSRDGKFSDAAAKYNKLLNVKPNIEEAKWEYCKVLIELKKWPDAANILESLLEIDPGRSEYLIKAGTVAINNKQYQQAIKYFGQVFQKEPFKPVAVDALEGLVESLLRLGKNREAFPLLQQLNLRKPNDPMVILRLARTAKKIGQMEKAVAYYSALATHYPVEDRDLLDASSLSENLGLQEKALVFQLKYLKRHPYYLPFQKKVADYYLKAGKKHLALPHLLVLTELREDNDDLLLLISKIYQKDENRPDKALFYLEKYQKKHPQNKEIAEKIYKARGVLANDLLSIVLNDGANMLWRDLKKITPNRQAIFETMANILDRQNKEKRLFEVLEIIHNHNPLDSKITLRLAKLAYERKEYKTSYNYLKKIKKMKVPGYFLLRAKVEEMLGDQQAALMTYLRSLKEEPDQFQTRKRALILAGEFGLIRDLHMLYQGIPRQYSEINKKNELAKIYIEGLLKSRLYSDIENIFAFLSRRLPKNNAWMNNLKLKIAESYFEEDQVFKAEQMVREILSQNRNVSKSLELLTRMAFESGNNAWGKAWLYLLSKHTGVNLLSKNYISWPEEEFYQKVELFVAEKNFQTAISLVRDYLKQLETTATTDKIKKRHRADLMLIRLLYKSKQYSKAGEYIHALIEKYPNDIELVVIHDKIRENKFTNKKKDAKIPILYSSKSKSPSVFLAEATYEYKYGNYKKAEIAIQNLLHEIPASVNGRILKGKILIAQNKFVSASKVFRKLSQEFPTESYFKRQVLELEFKRGNFKRLAQQIGMENPKRSNVKEDSGKYIQSLGFWKGLLLARSLWAEGRLKESIDVYQELLNTPVEKVFLNQIAAARVDINLPPLKRSIWDMVTFSNDQNSTPLMTVMEPLFVGAHLGSPIDVISAELYEKYRWQMIIKKELSAKKAVQNRNYHQAEKEYRALMKRGDSDESIYDLAKVYSRLELYGKEGELYQLLRKKGTEYPELNNLVRQNTLKRQPRVSFDSLYSDRKGREGYINVKKITTGIEGRKMPAFDQELDVRAERSYAISSDNTQKVWITKLSGTYIINFKDDNDLLINLGGNFANSEANILYKIGLKGRIDEYISGHISFDQGVVEDTVPAIRDGIYFRNFSTGLRFDPLPRFFFGGDFRYREYGDNNYQSRYHLWSSYDLFGETSLLQLKYDYNTMKNSRPNLGRKEVPSITDFAEGDLPYWSPDLYWRHLVTVRFKHNMENELSTSTGTSYYTLDYSFGYESGCEMVDSVGVNIFLEMNSHFLLKGNFEYYSAGDYRMKTGMFSVIYRW